MRERIYTDIESFNPTRGLRTRIGILRTPVRAHAAHTAINTSVPPEVAASLADHNNTVGHLKTEFFDPNNGKNNVLVVTRTRHGEKVSVVRPSAGYTELSVVVTGADMDLFKDTDDPQTQAQKDQELVDTMTIYDHSHDAQAEYWKKTIDALDSSYDIISREDDLSSFTVFAAENSVLERTGRKRTSRSIAIPHTHVVAIDHRYVEEHVTDNDMVGPMREQGIIKNISHHLADEVYSTLPDSARSMLEETQTGSPLNTKIRKRLNMPFGYTMQFRPDITAEEFAEFMYDNHKAYTKIAQSKVDNLGDRNQERIIPQPSYRVYIYREENGRGNLSVIITPEFISHGGLIEACGLKLNRNPKNVSHYDEARIEKFGTKIAEQLKGIQ